MPVIYRIENQKTEAGLWYNMRGEKTDFIKSIEGSLCHDVPMDFDPDFAGGWFSAGETIEQMSNWFSRQDTIELAQAGYELFEITVPEYRVGNGHALFRREGAVFVPQPMSILRLS